MPGQPDNPAEAKENPEELLYHYTTEKGLYGILEGDSIWATHYRFFWVFT